MQRRDCVAVQLAVGSQRQRLYRDVLHRDHVLRQGCAHERLQLASFQRLGRALCRHAGCNDLRLAVAAHGAGAQIDAGMLRQHRFDFAQFDAEAAQLHLRVVATQIVQAPIRTPLRPVAGVIEDPADGERIGDESLRGERWPVPVAAGQTGAADVQIAFHADRYRRHCRIQHVHARVRDRLADGRRRIPHNPLDRRPDRRLSGTVQIPCRATFEHSLAQRVGQRFAAAQQPHAGVVAPADAIQHLPGRGRRLHERRPHLADRPRQTLGVAGVRGRADVRLRAPQQRHQQLQSGDIETVGRDREQTVVGAEIEFVRQRGQQIEQPAIGDDAALGPARAARGVDDVGDAVGGPRDVTGIVLGIDASGRRRLVVADHEHGRRRDPSRHARCTGAIGQDAADSAVLHHVVETLLRVGRIEWHVRCAGLEHGEDGHRQIDRPVQADAHPFAGRRTRLPQPGGERRAETIEVRVAQRTIGAGHGDRVRPQLRMAADLFGNRRRIKSGARGVVPCFEQKSLVRFAQQRQAAGAR